jgi:hypothetical protein
MARHDVTPMLATPRCGARTRKGSPCMSPAIVGARRCRMHGGRSPGPPRGNRNAVTHGFYTKEARAQREHEQQLVRHAKALIAESD